MCAKNIDTLLIHLGTIHCFQKIEENVKISPLCVANWNGKDSINLFQSTCHGQGIWKEDPCPVTP